jgi:hypothetical protein
MFSACYFTATSGGVFLVSIGVGFLGGSWDDCGMFLRLLMSVKCAHPKILISQTQKNDCKGRSVIQVSWTFRHPPGVSAVGVVYLLLHFKGVRQKPTMICWHRMLPFACLFSLQPAPRRAKRCHARASLDRAIHD